MRSYPDPPRQQQLQLLNQRKKGVVAKWARGSSFQMTLLLAAAFLWSSTLAQDIVTINQNQLIEDVQLSANSWAYYQVQIGERYYNPGDNVVFKVLADSFLSDPDIYISRKTNTPGPGPGEAEWHCQTAGSETCLVLDGQWALYDTFYFGVFCEQACSFKVKVELRGIFELTDSMRTTLRFSQYSTNLMKFYIPDMVKNMPVQYVQFAFEAENSYQRLQLFLAMSKQFDIDYQYVPVHVLEDGIGIRMTKKDSIWCTKCWVYLMLNVEQDNRYYVTSHAEGIIKPIDARTKNPILVNTFQQSCVQYTATQVQGVFVTEMQVLSGHADMYLTFQDAATDPNDSRILFAAPAAANKAIYLTPDERNWMTGSRAGGYYWCFYATAPFSAILTISEPLWWGVFNLTDETLATAIAPGFKAGTSNSAIMARFKAENIGQVATINVFVQADGYNDTIDAPKIYYKECSTNFDACFLTDKEMQGQGMKQIGTKSATGTRTGEFFHSCLSCNYIFSFVNIKTDYVLMNFRIDSVTYNPQDVRLDLQYKNVVKYGQFINYEINPATNADIQPNLVSLTITIKSMKGDADLFVSFFNANPNKRNSVYMSRRIEYIDQVTIVQTGDIQIFNRPLFFSVYGNCLSEFFVEFSYVLRGDQTKFLKDAVAIGDGANKSESLKDEFQIGLYSFEPWWSGIENRTIVFICDVVTNKVFFQVEWNDYPQHFITSLQDKNDIVAVYGSNDQYYHHSGGRYYNLLRPDFALADLVSEKPYIYSMYHFSMTPGSFDDESYDYQILELDKYVPGFSNISSFQDYRYFQVDMAAEFTIKMKRFPNQGKPVFYMKVMDAPGGGLAPRAENYHFKSSTDPKNSNNQLLTINSDQRVSRWPLCATYMRSLQSDGSQKCFIAIGATCEDQNSCAWMIKISQKYVVTKPQPEIILESWTAQPPNPIMADKYTNGQVQKGEIKYYYFPVNWDASGDPLILLNKTQIYNGGRNGDSKLYLNVWPDIDKKAGSPPYNTTFNYSTWVYPSASSHHSHSWTERWHAPEMISVCQNYMQQMCNPSKTQCAFIVGVAGKDDLPSSFRLKGFYANNRLYPDIARHSTLQMKFFNGSFYDIYWFLINDTVDGNTTKFDYRVTISTRSVTSNPDLYISLFDGRTPTDQDYDLASFTQGADSIEISDSLSLWEERGWDPRDGVVVVVAVKKYEQQMNYTIKLTNLSAPTPDIITVLQGASIQMDYTSPGFVKDTFKYFQFYNDEAQDFTLTLTMSSSRGRILYQRIGQSQTNNPIFTALPTTVESALGYQDCDVLQTCTLVVAGQNCHACWYFIAVMVYSIDNANYRLMFTKVDNVYSNSYKEVRIGSPTQTQAFLVPGQIDKRKFKLTGNAPVRIEVLAASGSMIVYVDQDPQKLNSFAAGNTQINNFLDSQQSVNGLAVVIIQPEDSYFHIGEWYYVVTKATGNTNAFVSINIKQYIQMDFVTNNHDQKFLLTTATFNNAIMFQKSQYLGVNELCKYHVFQVPGKKDGKARAYIVNLVIESLSPDLYPMLYLKRFSNATKPSDLSLLPIPMISEYDISFGQHPLLTIMKGSRFEYSFAGVSQNTYEYYILAVYQQTWGLSDARKSEYQIRVTADVDPTAQIIVGSPRPGPEPQLEIIQ